MKVEFAIKKIRLLILVVLISLGCETIIDVDLPRHEPVLVLNSFFGTDTTFIVTLHESKDILDRSFDFKSVTGATIELYGDNSLLGTFTEDEGGYGYYFLDTYPEAGVGYSIVASRTGFDPVEAHDIIPLNETNPTVEEIDSRMDEYGNLFFELTYSMTDLPGENFYEVFVFAYIPRYEYYQDEDTAYLYQNGYWKEQIQYSNSGAELNEFEDTGDPSLFSDELFEGRKHTKTLELHFYHYIGDGNGEPNDNKIKFSLEVRSVSEAYYRYKISRRLQQDTQDNPFAEAAPVFNNIAGGYGIFAGYGAEPVEFEYNFE